MRAEREMLFPLFHDSIAGRRLIAAAARNS
jgi:hypothetical protein